MSKSILGLFIIVWLIICCIIVSAQEDADINNVKEHGIKRNVADYHPFLKDEKLTDEMQSLLMEVLRLERRKRALHKTKKKVRQFRNNSIYYNPVKYQQKIKKSLHTIDLFTLPTTRLDTLDDSTVSLITKPMSFWLKPLAGNRDNNKESVDKNGKIFDFNLPHVNSKQELTNFKKNAESEDDTSREYEDSDNSKENRKEDVSLEIQGSEDVLGLESARENEINNVIKDDDAEIAYHNNTNSKKREIRLPLVIQPVTQSYIPIPMNINREVSVLTKPSLYWLNQNKQLVNNLLLNNTMQFEDSNLTSARNIFSVPLNPRIVYYKDSSPIQQQVNSSVNGSAKNSKPSVVEKLQLTPLEILGLNRTMAQVSNVSVNKGAPLTTKTTQHWLDMGNMTKNATQNSTTFEPKLKKDANTTTADTSVSHSLDTTVASEHVNPINVSAEVSLLTKPSHYWTDPYTKNTTEAPMNVSVKKSVGFVGYTERVKLMAVNLSNVISMTSKPASDWVYNPPTNYGSSKNEVASNSSRNISAFDQDGKSLNQFASVTNETKLYAHNQTSFHNLSSSNASLVLNTRADLAGSLLKNEDQNIFHGPSVSRSVNNALPSVIRQTYAINEVPKIYFKQKEANKTKESNQNPSNFSNINQNGNRFMNVPITNFANSPQNFLNTKKNIIMDDMAANSLRGGSNIPQVSDPSMPKLLPQQFPNNPNVALSNLNMNSVNIQNEALLDKNPLLPQVYYTGALSEFNGNQNNFKQNSRNNFTALNENSATAANILSEIPFDIGAVSKMTFLNETNLLRDLETPALNTQYNFTNKNAMDDPQFHNNLMINGNTPQYYPDNFRNTSMDQNNLMINEDRKSFDHADSNYNENKNGQQFKNISTDAANFTEPKSFEQNDNLINGNGITGNSTFAQVAVGKNNEISNFSQNNFESQYIPQLQNASLPKFAQFNSTQNITNNTHHFNETSNNQVPLNFNQNGNTLANQNIVQFQEPQLETNTSLSKNTLLTNNTFNMLRKDNPQVYVNNPHLLPNQNPATLKNISAIESSFSNSQTNNHMYNNTISSQFQGPSSFTNNSLAIKPYSTNEADNQFVNNLQLQDQRSFLVNNSFVRDPFFTNETNNQMNFGQNIVPVANNSVARLPTNEINQINNQNSALFPNNSVGRNQSSTNDLKQMSYNQNPVPLLVNSVTRNQFSTNEINQMNSQNLAQLANNSVGRNQSSTNELKQMNYNQNLVPSLVNSVTRNPFSTNEINQMNSQNLAQFANNSIGRNQSSTNELRQMSYNQNPVPLLINSVTRNPFSTNEVNQMNSQNLAQFANNSVGRNQSSTIELKQMNYNQNPMPLLVNSITRNPFSTNEINQMNSQNLAQFANNSVGRNQSSTNELNQINYNQNPTPLANNSFTRNPFSTYEINPMNSQNVANNSVSRNQPWTNENSQINYYQNQATLSNNSVARNQLVTNEINPMNSQNAASFANNSLSRNQPSSNEFNQINYYENQGTLSNNSVARNQLVTNEINPMNSQSFANNSVSRNQPSSNENNQINYYQNQGTLSNNSVARSQLVTDEINPMNSQNSASFANNSVAQNQFSVNQTNNQMYYNQTYSPLRRRDDKMGKEVNPQQQVQSAVFGNGNTLAKESMIKTIKDSLTMTFKNTTENINVPKKRDAYLERFGEQEPSYRDEYVPHYYGQIGKPLNIYSDDKEYLPHKYTKREIHHVEPDEDLENEESLNSNSLYQFENMKRFEKKNSVPSDESGELNKDEDQMFHKIIKRAYPIFNYDDGPDDIDRESYQNDEQYLHKTIKRDSPVNDEETDYQDTPENNNAEANLEQESVVQKRGSILRESLKSRSDSIRINNNGGDTQLDSNLGNPKFQKFLQRYVSDLALNGRKRSNGLGASTKLPTLVEALQKYIKPNYTLYNTTPSSAIISSTDVSNNQLDIIDMNSLLRTVDVMSTVDRYGYALEAPHTKPSNETEPYFDFSIMTKMPFLFNSPLLHLPINNVLPNNTVKKKAPVTTASPTAFVKLRSAGAANVTVQDKMSKKSADISKKDCYKNDIEADLQSFRNILKKYHTSDDVPRESLRSMFDTVNDIKLDKIGRSVGSVSGMSCNFHGSWLSTVAGMRIDLNQTNNNTFAVSLASKVPPPKSGLLYTDNCTDWILSARLPMKKTSIIQVTGINEKEKKLAVFLGECRVCNDKNFVYGHWIVLRESRNCEDIFSTQESYTDLWRQESLHTVRLHNLHLLKMSLALTDKPPEDPLITQSGQKVTAAEESVTISITNGSVAIIGGATGVVSMPPDAVKSIEPSGGEGNTGDGPAVVTGVVPAEDAVAVTSGGESEVASKAVTNSVNIVVGKKSIAIKL